MRPIPVSWLCHSAELYATKTDAWQRAVDEKLCDWLRVRLEPSARRVLRGNVEEQATLTLFADAVASDLGGHTPEIGQIVRHDGRRYEVARVETLYDRNRLHHWELELICRGGGNA